VASEVVLLDWDALVAPEVVLDWAALVAPDVVLEWAALVAPHLGVFGDDCATVVWGFLPRCTS
jgi:hypothetical protein